MKFISLLHPFTAQAIGLEEKDLYHSHSKSQELALQHIQSKNQNINISIDYFTGKVLPYQKLIHNLTKKFWPVTRPLFNKRHQWRQQESVWHYKHQQKHPAELTIINMSAYASEYVFKLARLINKQKMKYIPMLGGIHFKVSEDLINYYQNAHHIIVHTQVQKKNLLLKDQFKNLDIRVLPLGVDISLFKPAKSATHSSAYFSLIQVGRISKVKNIECSINLIAFLKKSGLNVKLKLIGAISDQSYYKKLSFLIKTLQLEDNISFIDAVEQEKLVEFYQVSDLLLMPSHHESFGMVMIEAMACGCPVVGFKGSGGTDEIIVNGKNGLLLEKDEFEDTILKLLKDKEYLQSLKQNALESVKQNWSIEVTTSILSKSIEDGLDG
ncbi:glycosyltransferase family 4 protein [Psychroflexus sp. CAK8W]|uniref:Glycosyltransferase family 4 protein n=1 Tax=Psychroflexus longus TaxID=2873596 RepID=A0ABS7XL03_9FLAO|nr:glycosyltransferase family 4 protein [Psychroflexus longus]MBZ9779440.1 glycosyltransferase family 4 protein [Psychroflexus longus]